MTPLYRKLLAITASGIFALSIGNLAFSAADAQFERAAKRGQENFVSYRTASEEQGR